eukprot:COSAG01_NODE_18885_length_1047_cov_0.748945_1_plen_70_part_10
MFGGPRNPHPQISLDMWGFLGGSLTPLYRVNDSAQSLSTLYPWASTSHLIIAAETPVAYVRVDKKWIDAC